MTIQSTLFLGGARSGKSRAAEQYCLRSGLRPTYIATAQADDDEMVERIRRHQESRADAWRTVEEPLDLASEIERNAGPLSVILIDCLTLWLSNLMESERDVASAVEDLLGAIIAADGSVVLVSNEVGQGIVPDNALAREFRDLSGRMNTVIADAVKTVFVMHAGLPMTLKRDGEPVYPDLSFDR